MENIQFIIKDYQLDKLGIGNVLKNLISALSVNNDTVIECYNNYSYGQYQTILDDKFIFKGPSNKRLEKVTTCRLLIHKHEEEFQDNIPDGDWYIGGLNNYKFSYLFSYSRKIDTNYDPLKVHPMVKNRIFATIDKIIFRPIITDMVNIICEPFKLKRTLGLSIRTWKASHENNINRAYNFETYKDKILEVLDKHNDINMIVISIDNHTFLDKYIELFNERNIETIVLNKTENINDIQYAIIKALVLAKCNYCIGNRISTFSELIFWFSKHETIMYPVF
jgi:hypothetical protein